MTFDFTAQHRGGSGSPMLLIHGFTDTWRSWDLVRPALERHHDVLAVTLPGHAGGPDLPDPVSAAALVDVLEQAMDDAGFQTAHLVGNSLGGYAAFHLAARGRAESVVALAPAGGWAHGDESGNDTLAQFVSMDQLLQTAVQYAGTIVSTPAGRRQATSLITVNFEHLEPSLVEGLIRGAAGCLGVAPLVDYVKREGWAIDAEQITCPVRVVWGTEDRLLRWPSAAARYRDEWASDADWVILDGVGHCIQLDVPEEAARLILDWTSG